MYKKTILSISLSAIFLAMACTSEVQPTSDECDDTLIITFSNTTNSNCGQADGGFTVNVTGGNGDYTYQLGTNTAQANPEFSNLAASSYSISVVSSDGCEGTATAQVLNTDGVNASLTSTASDCYNPSGTITVTATDGQGPYEYQLNDNGFQSSPSFNSLSPGTYDVSVRDANGCEVDLEASIASDVTFTRIKNIVTLNCATSGCHDGTISPNFTSDATIVGRADRIRSRTSAGTMPPASRESLSSQEVADIVCWVNDGAQGN